MTDTLPRARIGIAGGLTIALGGLLMITSSQETIQLDALLGSVIAGAGIGALIVLAFAKPRGQPNSPPTGGGAP